MNPLVALLLSVLFASEQAPQNRDQPSGGTTVMVRVDGKGSIGLLTTADRIAVERYEKDLRTAGLTSEEIAVLVADEIQVRIAAAKAAPPPPGALPPSVFEGPGMGAYVRALVLQGVRGRDLASAINAERARRRAAAAKVPGKTPDAGGKVPARSPAKAPAASGAGKGSGADRKAPPKTESRPRATVIPPVVSKA